MTQFYTYLHRRKDDGRVFYVGKGHGLRASQHKNRSDWWKHVAQKHGFEWQIAAKWEDEASAFSHERLLISIFRELGHPLVNILDGGQGFAGGKHSDEWKAAMSSLMRAKPKRKLSEETKKKLSAHFRQNKPIGRRGKLSQDELDRRQQKRNATYKRYAEDGMSLTIKEWAAHLGVHRTTIDYRLSVGKTPSGRKVH